MATDCCGGAGMGLIMDQTLSGPLTYVECLHKSPSEKMYIQINCIAANVIMLHSTYTCKYKVVLMLSLAK